MMPSLARITATQVVGTVLALCGFTVAVTWMFQIDAVTRLVPGVALLGVVNPLLFLCCGICLVGAHLRTSQNPWPSRIMTGALIGLIALPLGYLFETFSGTSIGIDVYRPTPGALASPHPGRISPNASLGFLLTGTALWLHSRAPSPARSRVYLAMVVTVAIIGISGLAGYFLGLENLYQIASYNRMLPATALGLTIVSMGLWLMHEENLTAGRDNVADIERRIGRRSGVVIALVALGGGLAGFSMLRDTFEEAIERNMLLTATTTANSLSSNIETGLGFPKAVASRPTVRESMAKLHARPDDALTSAYLQKIADSFLTAGLTGVEFYSTDGRLVSRAGALSRPLVPLVQRLENAGQLAFLVWKEGYFLATENEVREDGQLVGRVLTEQRLRLFDNLLTEVRALNDSSDAVICARQADKAVCAPTRFRATRFEHSIAGPEGGPGETLARALKGERGVLSIRDGFGKKVVSGYAPIGNYGLGFAFKTDVRTLYQPLQHRLNLLIAALVILLGLGMYFQRSQVRPLVHLLVSSENRLKAILEDQTELVSLARPDGRLIYVNPAYARHFNLTPADMIGANLFEHVDPADRPIVQQHLASVISSGTTVTSENRMRSPAGGECWVSWTNSAQRDESGQPVLHSVGRDVTARRRAEMALQTSQAFLARTGRVAGVGGWEMEIATGAVTWSEETRRIHEVGPEFTPTLENALAFYPAKAKSMLEEAVQRGIETGIPWDLEVPFVTGRGRHIWVRAQGEVEFDQGISVRLVGAFQDITVRKALEQELHRQTAALRSVTEAIPAMVAVVGIDGRYRFVNSAFERWVGSRRTDIVGKTLEQVLGQVDYHRSLPWVEKALAGETVSFERDYSGQQVASHLGLTYTPLWDGESVDGFVSVALDLSAHKQEQGRLLQLAQQDPLTGLLNRAGFEEYLEARIVDGEPAPTLALLYVDLDHFKPVNDTHGHPAGDQVLQIFAERLQAIVRPTDAVARLGGDEFAVALPGLQDIARAKVIADQVVAAARAPVIIGKLTLQISASVGIALGSATTDGGWRDLVLRADAMLYQAKAAGRGKHASECVSTVPADVA